MKKKTANTEIFRQTLQSQLDSEKTQLQRNIMGQFATPYELALEILGRSRELLPPRTKIRFLDPAFGTGSFYSALLASFPAPAIGAAVGYEVDDHYGSPAAQLWAGKKLELRIADFTVETPPTDDGKFNLLICNPPYVRHHHITTDKKDLQRRSQLASKMRLSGLAGLYCYFMALSHSWLAKDGLAAWLIPSEFMDVNYGTEVKRYLLNEVTLLQIHRFDPNDVQFDDALVSSCVVWFRRDIPNNNHNVRFTYGGKISDPIVSKNISRDVLSKETKWTRFPLQNQRSQSSQPKLGDFFLIKRGIATGDNKYFVLTRKQIEERDLPLDQFQPILPSPRRLQVSEVESDRHGIPQLPEQLFVLDSKLHIDEIKQVYPSLFCYLREGMHSGVTDRYICRNRKLWYAQENRPPSPFYCTYIGRSDAEQRKPFRFIFNHSRAIVSNSYLILYPKFDLKGGSDKNADLGRLLISALNRISTKDLLAEGRVYGGGMHKIEPKELANVPASEIKDILFDVGLTVEAQRLLDAAASPRRESEPRQLLLG